MTPLCVARAFVAPSRPRSVGDGAARAASLRRALALGQPAVVEGEIWLRALGWRADRAADGYRVPDTDRLRIVVLWTENAIARAHAEAEPRDEFRRRRAPGRCGPRGSLVIAATSSPEIIDR